MTEAEQTGPAPGSYEEFVTATSAKLLRAAYLLTGSRHDAEDLLQASLVKLYVAWRKAEGADSTEAYARRVLMNTFISSRRPARFTRERLFDDVPEDRVDDRDPAERLAFWPRVMALPPRQRAVIVLRYYEDLSEQEIADTLGCAVGTVKSTANAALKRLRNDLEEE